MNNEIGVCVRSVITSCKTRLCRSRDITAGSFYLMTTRQTSLRESDECTRHLCPSIEHQPHLETHQDSSQLSVVRCLRASSCKYSTSCIFCEGRAPLNSVLPPKVKIITPNISPTFHVPLSRSSVIFLGTRHGDSRPEKTKQPWRQHGTASPNPTAPPTAITVLMKRTMVTLVVL